jgi:hypothetical protein
MGRCKERAMENLLRGLAFAAASAWLAACAPVDGSVRAPHQFTVECPQQQRLFIADSRNGTVQALAWREGPVPLAQLQAPGRDGVEALAADVGCRRLWVRGGGRLYAYDTATLELVAEQGLSAPSAASPTAFGTGETGSGLVAVAR